MYKISGSILSDDSEMLQDVEIVEFNAFDFPTGVKTKTDDGGQFSMNLQSDQSSIAISLFGYKTQMINAADFMKDQLVYLEPAIIKEQEKSNSNTVLYVVLGVAVVTVIALATRDNQPKPKQIKIA